VIFSFHGYPWLVHRLCYQRHGHDNLHVRGYREKGSINTPLELAIRNQVDRFSLAIDVIDRVPHLQDSGAHLKQRPRDLRIDALAHAHEHGVDADEIRNWRWS
jgi:xylulose-5-phosphate/fructose-6-phosphate phosphoketolase